MSTKLFSCSAFHLILNYLLCYNILWCCFCTRFAFASGADEKVIRVFAAPKNFVENLGSISQIDVSDALTKMVNYHLNIFTVDVFYACVWDISVSCELKLPLISATMFWSCQRAWICCLTKMSKLTSRVDRVNNCRLFLFQFSVCINHNRISKLFLPAWNYHSWHLRILSTGRTLQD